MEEISDEELNQLFQENDGSQHISFEESSWLLLEKRLKKHKRRILYKKFFFLGSAALLTIAGAYFLLTNILFGDRKELAISEPTAKSLHIVHGDSNNVDWTHTKTRSSQEDQIKGDTIVGSHNSIKTTSADLSENKTRSNTTRQLLTDQEKNTFYQNSTSTKLEVSNGQKNLRLKAEKETAFYDELKKNSNKDLVSRSTTKTDLLTTISKSNSNQSNRNNFEYKSANTLNLDGVNTNTNFKSDLSSQDFKIKQSQKFSSEGNQNGIPKSTYEMAVNKKKEIVWQNEDTIAKEKIDDLRKKEVAKQSTATNQYLLKDSTYLEDGAELSKKHLLSETHNPALHSGKNSVQVKDIKKADSLSITSNATKVAEKKPAGKTRIISLQLMASPDFSSTYFYKFDKPGFSLGASMEFHFGSRLSAVIGFIRSSKTYSSKGGYSSNESYWVLKNKADRIDGACTIYDIPINVKFNILAKPRSIIFVSSGLSTYLMRHEKYSFIFSSTNSSKSWEHYQQRNYYLGVVNLSAGIEKHLFKQLSIQAEPFFKVPLKSIGDGGVLLLSSGIFLGLKYTIL